MEEYAGSNPAMRTNMVLNIVVKSCTNSYVRLDGLRVQVPPSVPRRVSLLVKRAKSQAKETQGSEGGSIPQLVPIKTHT